jgi:pimeloyl-ACP methyl ester carboxylesterase
MRRLLVVFALVACREPSPPAALHADRVVDASPAPVALATPDAEARPPALEPATVERVAVPKDVAASIVRGEGSHIAFMPGLCSNAYAYMLGFPEAARAHGGVVAIEGDAPCEGAPGFRSFTWSPRLQRARIEAAFAAANVPIPKDGLTLVGYSAGASIAEMMHQKWPELFPKLVLIAPPMAPKIDNLRKAHAVVAMSCSLDVPYLMKAAAKSLTAIDVPAKYVEMPKCTHGQLANGEQAFGEAFDWLDAR